MSLSISEIIHSSLRSIRKDLPFYLALTLLFFCLSVSFELYFLHSAGAHFLQSLIILLLSAAVYAKQAVVIHRSVILGEGGQWRQVFRWGAEDSLYFFVGLGLGLVFALIAGFILAMFESMILDDLSSTSAIQWFGWISSLVLLFAAGVAFSLICLFFPAAAAGHNMSLVDSVAITEQHFLKVFLLVAALPFICSVLVHIVRTELGGLMTQVLINLVAHFLVVFYVSLLSHTYLQLTREQPKPVESEPVSPAPEAVD